jgi:uncharacterized protein with HEPN domain
MERDDRFAKRLVDDYGHIDLRIIWDVLDRDVPGLIQVLEHVVPPPDE